MIILNEKCFEEFKKMPMKSYFDLFFGLFQNNFCLIPLDTFLVPGYKTRNQSLFSFSYYSIKPLPALWNAIFSQITSVNNDLHNWK